MLLQTKLFIPQTRAPLVERQRLIDLIVKGKDCKLILVCAPAGFGKTSLVCQWIQQETPRIVWYAIDEDDSKPEVFSRYLLTALQMLDSRLKNALMPLVQGQTVPPPERLMTLLIHHLVHLSTDSYLVLDDYHLIQPETSPVHEIIRGLLQHVPPQFHLVILTRHELPFPIARLRVNHEITEIHGADLRFTETETAQFFEHVSTIQLSEAQVQTLHERTEGWIAGLQLAGISIRDQMDIDRLMTHFTGIHRPVADYLLEEVFQDQPQSVQEFLLKTSLLKRLHAGLCNELTEWDNAAEMLAYLERTNLFVFSLDAERQWYRYHHLLVEFLQHRFQQNAKELWGTLHNKAALWYADHGYFDDACFHAFASGDPEFATDLLEQHGPTMFRNCQFASLRHWLGKLPDELVNQHLLLKVNRVVLLFVQEDFLNMGRLLTELEQSLPRFAQCYPETIIHQGKDFVTALRLFYLSFLQEHDQVIREGRQALQSIAQEHQEARGLIQMALATAFFGQGDILLAIDPLKAGFEVMSAAKEGYTAASLLWLRIRVEKLQGHLQCSEASLHDAFQWVRETEFVPLPVTVGLHTAFAEISYERNHLIQALEHVEQGLEYAGASMTKAYLWLGYWIKACICQAQGEFEKARQLMQKALTIAQRTGTSGRIRLVEALAVSLALRRGETELSMQWTKHRKLRLDEPFSHVFEQECLTLAGVYLAQQRYQEAVDLLTGLRPQSESRNRMESVLKIDILHAAALDRLGKRNASLFLLEQAIVFARPEGYIRMFMDQALRIVDLLCALQCSQDKRVRAYVPVLLDACGIASTPPSSHFPINDLEYLTPREVEILSLIAAGSSNQQIADQTFVALSTVKTHIKHIYGKLGLTNRIQAMLWAKEHLLED